jgi:hypothetical protein
VQLKISTYVSVSRKIYCKSHAGDHASDAGKAAQVRAEQLKGSSSTVDSKLAEREERERKEREAKGREVAARMKREAGTGETQSCRACGKRVYAAEKIAVQILTYEDAWEFHKTCFRCSEPECHLQLNLRNYSSIGGALYCAVHVPKQQQAKADGAYFVSPLHDDKEFHVEEEQGDNSVGSSGAGVGAGDDLDLAEPGYGRSGLSKGVSARILEEAENLVSIHEEKVAQAVLREDGVELPESESDSSEMTATEIRAAKREARRKELEEEMAREEAALEKRREERRARRAAMDTDDGDSGGGGHGHDHGDGDGSSSSTSSSSSSRSERRRGDSSNDLDEFEKRKAERRARLEALRKG